MEKTEAQKRAEVITTGDVPVLTNTAPETTKLAPKSGEKITKNRDQDYTKIVQGIKKLKKPISKVQSILNKKNIDKKGVKKELAPMYPYNRALNDILEKVVKPLYGKEIDMNNLKVGDVKIIKPNIDSSQDTLNELLLTLVDAVNELNGHTPVKPEKTLEEKFEEYRNDEEGIDCAYRCIVDLAQIAEEHYKDKQD